ncbi:uncharacterized protein DUF4383 [Frondihabitans sp. PhB188]|uniref:DUF4383 domain-containing protein n=1 Tax=Frondihabitans sp. PhB188 TaxID=2485200 RepID=UPI000F47FDFF|nr:DUF4383 domain-containing protein [Frondihabitans sp. PhB188]ROQ40029.1 uncharacterized protein DUF4383 [Frondihabitans sp. PhB188]
MIHSPNRLLSLILGIVFLLIGLFGFFVATPLPFATAEGAVLIGLFGVNAALSTIHVLVGAALLLAGLGGVLPAKLATVVLGAALVVFSLVGFGIAHTGANIFALNTPDNLLHLFAGLLLVAFGLTTDKVILKAPKLA